MHKDPQTLLAMGARLHAQGDFLRASELYSAALALMPDHGECALLLGMALFSAGNPGEAVAPLRRAAELMPGDADALNPLGAALFQSGDLQGAREAYASALAAAPNSPDALDGTANVLQASGRPDEAVSFYERALENGAGHTTLANLGSALKAAGKSVEAIARLQQALEIAPEDADTLINLANAWQSMGDMEQARDCFAAALEVDPNNISARWGLTFAHIPMLFDHASEIAPAREAYSNALAALETFLADDESLAAAADVVGANQPFYLAYHGENDRALQARYGTLCHRAMSARFPEYGRPIPARHKRPRLRVGILSGLMQEHSVWKIPARGWAEGLNRDHFEVFGYHVGFKRDHATDEAAGLFDHFYHEPLDFNALVRTVRNDELDALLYPEIGMAPTALRAACLRLAPVQAVSLGHPMTTGLPTMDYFLTSELMDPENGQEWYTEKLVRLPNLGVRYKPLPEPERTFTRADFGLPKDGFLYFCPQSLFKYLPQHDEVFARIAEQVPEARFVFVEHLGADSLTRRFLNRLGRAFSSRGLKADNHVLMLPHQSREFFHGLNTVCDLFLDSLGWAGFNTAMEASGAGLPAICCPRPSENFTPMRAHHCAAVLRMMGHEQCIAPDIDSYVRLAAQLAKNPAELRALKLSTEEHRTRLYGDDECIRGLEDFLLSACNLD